MTRKFFSRVMQEQVVFTKKYAYIKTPMDGETVIQRFTPLNLKDKQFIGGGDIFRPRRNKADAE